MGIKRTSLVSAGLPGLPLALGVSLLYAALIIVLPLLALVAKAATMSLADFVHTVTAPRLLASYKVSLGSTLVAALVSSASGLLLAWVLVRYRFPGRRLVDALIDLPFALPTAVAGLALTAIYADTGWLGHALSLVGIKVAYTPLGIVVALVFIGLPFQVRTVQPVLADLDVSWEEAAATLGATAWQRFRLIILPELLPALLTAFALAFARGLGEYGSVIFIAGNIPMVSEITPLLIVSKLEQYDYAGATAIAVVMLVASFALLLLISGLTRWAQRPLRQQAKGAVP